MRSSLILVCLALMLGSGCSSLVDARGPSEFCEVHHGLMESIQVKGPAGEFSLPQDYLELRMHRFPHAYPDFPPGGRSKWVIYICEDCVRAQQEWKRTGK